MKKGAFWRSVCSVALATLVVGCAVNPVTGQRELHFFSADKEIAMGETNYEPLKQIEGGEYTLDPTLTAYVQSIVKKLSSVTERPDLPYEIVILDTSVVNAWALPGGKMGINRGLLEEMHNEAELAAVLGHEITHAAARHSAKQLERATLMLAGLAIADAALRDDKNSTTLLAGASLATYLMSLSYSRHDETEADHYGMLYMERAGYDPQQAVTLQETFLHLAEGKTPSKFAQLLSTHPPSQARIDANQAHADTLTKGLFIGKAEYEAKTRYLMRTAPAYDAYDEAMQAFEDNDFERAQTLVDSAIAIEPRGHQFYRLKGEIAYEQKDYAAAQVLFSKAITLSPEYYLNYLYRGLAHEKLREYEQAIADLEKSVTFLETEQATKAIGRIKRSLRKAEKRAKRHCKHAHELG